MKRIIFLLALVAVLVPVRAERIYEYAIKIGDFEKLQVLDNVNVIYRCNPDSTGYAAYRGAQEFDDSFIFSNSNGTLKIQVNTEDVNNPDLPVLTVYSDFLLEAMNSSLKTLTVSGPAATPSFKARQIGNGKIVVDGLRCTSVEGSIDTGNGTVVMSGRCSKARLRMLGTGLIQADRLEAKSVECSILGSGSIGCWPVESLKVKGIGSTRIYYKGSPENIKKSGGGKLIRLDSNDESEYGILPEA